MLMLMVRSCSTITKSSTKPPSGNTAWARTPAGAKETPTISPPDDKKDKDQKEAIQAYPERCAKRMANSKTKKVHLCSQEPCTDTREVELHARRYFVAPSQQEVDLKQMYYELGTRATRVWMDIEAAAQSGNAGAKKAWRKMKSLWARRHRTTKVAGGGGRLRRGAGAPQSVGIRAR